MGSGFAWVEIPLAFRSLFHCLLCLIFITINNITGTMINVRNVANTKP